MKEISKTLKEYTISCAFCYAYELHNDTKRYNFNYECYIFMHYGEIVKKQSLRNINVLLHQKIQNLISSDSHKNSFPSLTERNYELHSTWWGNEISSTVTSYMFKKLSFQNPVNHIAVSNRYYNKFSNE